MAVDILKLSPESFRTLFLRKEDKIILRTEAGKRIVIKESYQKNGYHIEFMTMSER